MTAVLSKRETIKTMSELDDQRHFWDTAGAEDRHPSDRLRLVVAAALHGPDHRLRLRLRADHRANAPQILAVQR